MKNRIICPFRIITSHLIEKPGFLGLNKIKITTPFEIRNPLGLKRTFVIIEKIDETTNFYKFVIESEELNDIEDQIIFINNLAKIISTYFNITEVNPHYGNNFIKIEWFHLEITSKNAGSQSLVFRDKLSIKSERIFKMSSIIWPTLLDNTTDQIITFYYLGLKAESETSKYFYWFLILEILENTEAYKNMHTNYLFSESEKQKIKELTKTINDPRKRGIIESILKATREARHEKLYNFIKNVLRIEEYRSWSRTIKITSDIIKKIIDIRHKIFHASEFTEVSDILWGHLFPLVTKIVEKHLLNHPHSNNPLQRTGDTAGR